MVPNLFLLSYWLLMASRKGAVVVSSCVTGGASQNPTDNSIPMVIRTILVKLWESHKKPWYKKLMKLWGSDRGWGSRDDVVYSNQNVLYRYEYIHSYIYVCVSTYIYMNEIVKE